MFRNMTKVVELHIVYTHTRDIFPQFFEGLSSLNVLNLAYNRIFEFNPLSANQIWNLSITNLVLCHNNLYELSSNAFKGLNNLMSLDLSDNPQLTILDASLHSGLSNLINLDVSRTSLTGDGKFYVPKLQNFLFSGRWQMRVISFVSFFRPDSFKNALSQEFIKINDSYISSRELMDLDHKVSIFHGLTKLYFLDISGNNLETLLLGLFPRLPSLLEINLSRCKLKLIQEGVFTNLVSLRVLHLDQNSLFRLPNGMFNSPMREIEILYLHSNMLDHIHDDFFVHLQNVTNLTLSNNKLAKLNQSTFAPISSTLLSVDISDNPLECSCHIKWILGWRNSSMDILRANDTICSAGSAVPFRGKPLFTIDPSGLCASYLALYVALPLAAVGLVSIVSFAYTKRWLIKYKFFLLRLAVIGYEELHDPNIHADYEFDLNVMFTPNDERWAMEHLRPKIEENIPNFQRIAFGDDDLPLGKYYLDAVLYVIEHSFKTVLLLSRAATQDHEFMMKLRTALNHVTDTRTLSTILIFLEAIPDHEMPHLVKLYLSEERPYIFWVEDEWGKKYFWKKLNKKLKVNLRCDDRIPPE